MPIRLFLKERMTAILVIFFSLISIIEVVEPVAPVTGREQEDGGGDAVNYCKRWVIM